MMNTESDKPNMFSIYQQKPDASLELLERAKNGAHAFFLLRQYSQRMGGTIVSIETLPDGTTLECCRFRNGQMIWSSHPATAAQQRCCGIDGIYKAGNEGYTVARGR